MASTEWIEIYASYNGDELEREIERLKTQATFYTSQGEGDRQYTKDIREVRDRLHAAIRIRNQRREAGRPPRVFVPDFSGM